MLLDRYKHKLYQSGLKMVLYVSVRELFKCDVLFLHSLDKGLYCQILSDTRLNSEDISRLKDKMTEIINANGAYIGIFVPEGQHFIEFKYQTP